MRDPPGASVDIHDEIERRCRLGDQALGHRPAGKADLERRGVVDPCVSATPDVTGNLDGIVASKPEEQVDQVRAQIKQRATSSLGIGGPARVQRLTTEHARDCLDFTDRARGKQIMNITTQREPAGVASHVTHAYPCHFIFYRRRFLLVQSGRLFRQHVLAGAYRRQGDRAQQMVRRGNKDSVDRRLVQEGSDRRVGADVLRQGCDPGDRRQIWVGTSNKAEGGGASRRRGKGVPLVAAPHKADAQHAWHLYCRGGMLVHPTAPSQSCGVPGPAALSHRLGRHVSTSLLR